MPVSLRGFRLKGRWPTGELGSPSVKLEGSQQSSPEFGGLRWGEGAHEIGEHILGKADQLVAVDTAVVLQSFSDAHPDLSGETVIRGINGCADHRGETGIDDNLTAHNHEDPRSLWIARRPLLDAIQLTASHTSTWYDKTSAASRLRRAACVSRISRSRASLSRRASKAIRLRTARSMTADRFLAGPANRSISAIRSSESVIEVLVFILPVYHRWWAWSRGHPPDSNRLLKKARRLPPAADGAAAGGALARSRAALHPDLLARRCWV